MSFFENHRGYYSMMMPFLRYLNATLTNNLRKVIQHGIGRRKNYTKTFWGCFSHNERMQDFQFVCQTKGKQTKTSTFSSVHTQTECQFPLDFAAPCNIKDLSNKHSPVSVEQESGQTECDSQNEYDSDFIMQEKPCNESWKIPVLSPSH